MGIPAPRLGLAVRQTLSQRLEQHQIQALECLQLGTAELADWLEAEAERLPALCLMRPAAAPQAPSEGAWWNQVADGHETRLEEAALEIRCAQACEEARLWALFLLEQLDGLGLLREDDEACFARGCAHGCPAERGWFAAGRALLERCGSLGLGARTPGEALLLQLDPTSLVYSDACRLIEGAERGLTGSESFDILSLAAKLGKEDSELKDLLATLRGLLAPPALEQPSLLPRLVPELEVLIEAGELVVRHLRDSLPEIRVEEDLARLARERKLDRAVCKNLSGIVAEARRVAEAVRMRGETLLLVGAALFRHQDSWLRGHRRRPLPLSMAALARELGLATSTVSRAVGGKCAVTPRGTLFLRDFFSQAVAGQAQDALRDALGELLTAEVGKAPRSDAELARVLKQKGFSVARRTVAKYRSEMGVKGCFGRRTAAGRGISGRQGN